MADIDYEYRLAVCGVGDVASDGGGAGGGVYLGNFEDVDLSAMDQGYFLVLLPLGGDGLAVLSFCSTVVG